MGGGGGGNNSIFQNSLLFKFYNIFVSIGISRVKVMTFKVF